MASPDEPTASNRSRSSNQQVMKPNFESDTEEEDDTRKNGILPLPFLSPTYKGDILEAILSYIATGEKEKKRDDEVKRAPNKYKREHLETMKAFSDFKRITRRIASTPGSYRDADMRVMPGNINRMQRERNNEAVLLRQNGNDHPGDANLQRQRERDDGLGGVFGAMVDEDDERDASDLRNEREANEVIAKHVQQYKDQGVPEDEFEVIHVPPRADQHLNLTLRRIILAVMAVVTAFLLIMLQTLPLLGETNFAETELDLHEFLNLREFSTHFSECGKLLGRSERYTVKHPGGILTSKCKKVDCGDGVLHIPTVDALHQSHNLLNGVNITWMHDCKLPKIAENTTCLPKVHNPAQLSQRPQCFRGVHDGIITSEEVQSVLLMAQHLIKSGGDHVPIRFDVHELQRRVPSVVTSLEHLLREEYKTPPVKPIAFRVSVSVPVDVQAWQYNGPHPILIKAINTTSLVEWEESYRNNNYRAYLPSFLYPRPFRDPCIVISDLEADDNFAFLTTVSLSTIGDDFTGGKMLYIDDHKDNSNPRWKVQRGVVIDMSRGRVIVSTGGEENMRCRLPTTSGIRAVLQVWWGCDDE